MKKFTDILSVAYRNAEIGSNLKCLLGSPDQWKEALEEYGYMITGTAFFEGGIMEIRACHGEKKSLAITLDNGEAVCLEVEDSTDTIGVDSYIKYPTEEDFEKLVFTLRPRHSILR